jgi:cell division protein FtsB
MNLFGWDHKTFRRNTVFVLALLSLVLVMHEIFGGNGYLTLRRQKKEYADLQQKIQTVKQQNQQLEQKIRALKDNPEAVEKQARDQLHLAKPGELIYVLPDRQPAQPPATAQQTSPKPVRPQR